MLVPSDGAKGVSPWHKNSSTSGTVWHDRTASLHVVRLRGSRCSCLSFPSWTCKIQLQHRAPLATLLNLSDLPMNSKPVNNFSTHPLTTSPSTPHSPITIPSLLQPHLTWRTSSFHAYTRLCLTCELNCETTMLSLRRNLSNLSMMTMRRSSVLVRT